MTLANQLNEFLEQFKIEEEREVTGNNLAMSDFLSDVYHKYGVFQSDGDDSPSSLVWQKVIEKFGKFNHVWGGRCFGNPSNYRVVLSFESFPLELVGFDGYYSSYDDVDFTYSKFLDFQKTYISVFKTKDESDLAADALQDDLEGYNGDPNSWGESPSDNSWGE